MRMSFEEISHTADVKIRVHAPTLEALFSETFNALMQVMYGTKPCQGVFSRRSGLNPLIMNHSLQISFQRSFSYQKSRDLSFQRLVSALTVCVSLLNLRVNHLILSVIHGGSEVKGISYSGLAITHDANGYMLDIIFDV